ncbi:unnamed protein product, partial [Didymodactylos carnosus]
YQPVDDPLIRSDYLSYKPLWQELFRPSQRYPTVLSASIAKILIAALSTDVVSAPLVPFVPIFSVLINIYLILNLQIATWIRFGVWMIAGFFIYGFYGFWHSSQRFVNQTQQLLSD